MIFSLKFLEKKTYYFKKIREFKSPFLKKKKHQKQAKIAFSNILAKIVLISFLVLVSKPEIERKKFSSQPRDWKKEILFLVSKHEIERKKFSFLSRKLKLASRHALEVQEKWCTLARSEFKNIYFHNVATWSRTFGNSCNGHILGQPNLALFADCINVGTIRLLLMDLLKWNVKL